MCRKKLSIKHLESFLQDIDGFDAPKLELEQYATPPHIAALVLNAIDSTYDDIEGNLVADLGCGTGRLTVGSIISGAKLVYGFDIDQEALKCGIRNINDLLSEEEASTDTAANAYLNCEKFNFIQADIASSNCDRFWEPWIKMFDTVVMNPPFGTKHNQGIDMIFLKRAVDLSHNSVYSLHKTSTREFISVKTRQWGVKQAKPIAQIRYNLENTYKFHKKKSVDIDVDLWQIKL